ncbi:TrbI/VirB10 family protein [Chlorogloeopsis sp. ULAP01]|uniref:TrbI/VirB10 family protein n=1 Tax=Chlorogloeopsis sp. ULAP01 TaxID=3056483 RepID=UPI0025AACEDE|nr:TrbI/VirB10 family protein [Chlorogloeopsis sp. ULAP01]MDM9383548.1 TrbI/VirB10 family protein [Chlorogloeopsis sp. ULAP01]
MLQLQDDTPNHHKFSSVDSLLPIDEDKKPVEDGIASTEDEVVDEEEIEAEDPALVQTKHDFVTSPWSRLGIIGGAFGVGFILMFVVLNGMINGGGNNAQKPEVIPTSTPTVTSSEKEEGDIYAKLALAKQQEELDALNGKKGEKEDEVEDIEEDKSKEKARPTRQQKVVTGQTTPNSRRHVYGEQASEPVGIRRTKVASQPIPPLRPSAPVPTIPSPNSSSLSPNLLAKVTKQTANDNQTIAKDPLAEIERLRSLGSVGRVEYTLASTTVSESTNTTVEEVSATEETVSPAQQNTNRSRRRRSRRSENTETVTNTSNQVEELRPRWQPITTNNSTPEYSNTDDKDNNQAVPVIYSFSVKEPQFSLELDKEKTVESSLASNKENNSTQQIEQVANNYLPEEAQILQETQPQYLVVGSFASATLVTPLVIPQTSNNSRSQEQTNTLRFVAQLDEPLYNNTGEIAIGAGTLLSITMISVDSTSGVRAEVTAILKDGTEYPVSPGTISVLGEAGSPLIARPHDDKGFEIAKYDATLGTIAGLAKVGEIINQPDEEVTEDLPLGGTRTRSRNNNRNLAAAFLEGAFSKLSETVSKRTERATDEINRRPNVWYVPKNTRVTIKVDRSIKL